MRALEIPWPVEELERRYRAAGARWRRGATRRCGCGSRGWAWRGRGDGGRDDRDGAAVDQARGGRGAGRAGGAQAGLGRPSPSWTAAQQEQVLALGGRRAAHHHARAAAAHRGGVGHQPERDRRSGRWCGRGAGGGWCRASATTRPTRRRRPPPKKTEAAGARTWRRRPAPHLLFADEAWWGLTTELGRVWTRGARPVLPVSGGRSWTPVMAAVEPATGRRISLVAGRFDARWFGRFLAEIAAAYPGERVILVVDNAGWHQARALEVPASVILWFLPPHSPELNPVEQVWQWLRAPAHPRRPLPHPRRAPRRALPGADAT